MFQQKNIINVLGILFGFLGIILSIYFYVKTLKEREPTFIIDPIRTEILDSKSISKAPIRVIKNDGEEIKSDLTTITFYFWNKGKQSIKKSNVLKKIQIEIDDPKAEILEYKILKISREVTDFQLAHPISNLKNLIELDFKIIETDDGITAQITYEGDPKANININGTIEGVDHIAKNVLSRFELITKTIINILLFILVLLIFMIIQGFADSTASTDPRDTKEYKENLKYREAFDKLDEIRKEILSKDKLDRKKTKKGISLKGKIILFSIFVLVFSGIITFSYYQTWKSVADNPAAHIPETIKPK